MHLSKYRKGILKNQHLAKMTVLKGITYNGYLSVCFTILRFPLLQNKFLVNSFNKRVGVEC